MTLYIQVIGRRGMQCLSSVELCLAPSYPTMSGTLPENKSITKAKSKHPRGRLRKQPLNELTNLQVTVEGKDVALKTTHNDLKHTDVLFSLQCQTYFSWRCGEMLVTHRITLQH